MTPEARGEGILGIFAAAARLALPPSGRRLPYGSSIIRPRESAEHFADLRDTNRKCGICTRCRKRPIARDTHSTRPGSGPSRCAECRDARRVTKPKTGARAKVAT